MILEYQIAREYWKNNFDKCSPQFKDIILESYNSNNNKFLYKMMLRENSNISKSDLIFQNLERSVNEGNLENFQIESSKIEKMSPSLVNTQANPQEYREMVSAIDNVPPTSKTKRFILKVKKIALWVIKHYKMLLIGLVLLSILFYFILTKSLNNPKSFINRHKFEDSAKKIRRFFIIIISMGLVYVVYKVVRFLLINFYPPTPEITGEEPEESESEELEEI